MLRRLVVLALLLALPIPASGQSVQQVFEEFGLIGTWARACAQPADGNDNNTHTIYSVAKSGAVTLTYDSGPNYRPTKFRIVNAKRIAEDRIVYLEERLDNKARITVTVIKSGSEIRVLSSVRESGEVLVSEGKFKSGQQSPPQTRCQN